MCKAMSMTFSEGMRIDTSTTTTSGGGRGRRGMAVGGGLGGLVVLLIALFLGVDPGGVMSQQPLDTQGVEAPGFDVSACRTGTDANTIVECRVIATGNSLDHIWGQLLQGYTRPSLRLFTGQVDTGCGPATSEVGPFYCPADQTAYFDTGFFEVLKNHPVPAAGRWPRSMWSPMSTATTYSSCSGTWPGPSAAAPAPKATPCVPNCRPTASPECGRTTPRSPSSPAPT